MRCVRGIILSLVFIPLFSINTFAASDSKAKIFGVNFGRYTNQEFTDMAKRLDLVILDALWYPAPPAILKQTNPNLKILAYHSALDIHDMSAYDDNKALSGKTLKMYQEWEEANSHEDWFLHDINGNRIRTYLNHTGELRYGLDIANTDFRNFILNKIKESVENGYDGIFMDNVWVNYPYSASLIPSFASAAPVGMTQEKWQDDAVGLLNAIKGAIGSRLLVFNQVRGELRDASLRYLAAADGAMDENWIGNGSFSDLNYFRNSLNIISEVNKADKISLPVAVGSSEDLAHFLFSSYLLVKDGAAAYFSYMENYNFKNMNLDYWFYKTDIGSPQGSYYEKDALFLRKYAQGLVIVNPGSKAITTTPEGNYTDEYGVTIRDISVGAKNGAILYAPGATLPVLGPKPIDYSTNSSLPVSLMGIPTEEKTLSIEIAQIPEDATEVILYATILDADHAAEGYFYINSSPNPTDITADKIDANYKIIEHKYSINKSSLVKGRNSFKFTHVATSGYEIKSLKIRFLFTQTQEQKFIDYVPGSAFPVSLMGSVPQEKHLSVEITQNPADSTEATLYATILDADNKDEGFFYINSDPKDTSITSDKIDSNYKIVEHKYALNKNSLVKGSNTITFTHVSTAGYEIKALKVRLTYPLSGANKDTAAPQAPTGLDTNVKSASQIDLSWTASIDDVGVSGYNIYRDGTKVSTSATDNYSDTGLAASTTYNYTISAYDAAGNESVSSSAISDRTLPDTSGKPYAGNLKAEGQASLARGTAIYPEFSWAFSDSDGDSQQGWEIQTHEQSPLNITDPAGDGTAYLSGKVVNPDAYYSKNKIKVTGWGKRSDAKPFRAAGRSHLYKWRIRLYDGKDWGQYSAWQSYLSDQIPNMPQNIKVSAEDADLNVNLAYATPDKPVAKVNPAPARRGGVNQASRLMRPGNALVIYPRAYQTTFYVKTPADGGNDANNGLTPETAVATINKALRLMRSGDTLMVYPGTYNEVVIVIKSASSALLKNNSLAKALPKLTNITIKGVVSRENQAIIDGTGLEGGEIVNGGAIYINSDDVTLENLTIKKANTGNSHIVVRGNNNKVLNTFTRPLPKGQGIYAVGNRCLIKNNKILSQKIGGGGDEPLLLVSGYGIDIIGNELAGSMGVKVARDSVGVHIIGNVVYDAGIMGGIYTDDGQNIFIAYNLIYGCGRGIMPYRTAHNYIINNSLVNNGVGIALDGAWDNYIYNNIITGSSNTGIAMGLFGRVYNSYLDYNLFYKNNRNYSFFDNDTNINVNDGGHNLSHQDPIFTSTEARDYTLSLTSPVIDKAAPGYPVTLGGGSLADIGAFEYGAVPWATFYGTGWLINGVPEFEPLFSLSASRPTISWDFFDTDTADKQYAFEIEIDKVNTFDSPDLLKSGTIISNKSRIKINKALSPGKYYLRLRTADNFNTALFSAWSNPDTAFEIP